MSVLGVGPYRPRVRPNLDVVYRRAALAARWLHETQTATHPEIRNQSVRLWGFHILRSCIDRGGVRFRPRFFQLFVYICTYVWKDF